MEKHFGFNKEKDIKEDMNVVNGDKYNFEFGKVYALDFYEVMVPISNRKHSIDFCLSSTNDFKNKVTLVKYLGDGKFQEYFTEQIVRIEKNQPKSYSVEETVEYYKKMMDFAKTPLCVTEKIIGVVEGISPQNFIKTTEEITDFCGRVNELIEETSKDLMKTLNLWISRDYDEAHIKNCVFEFERGNSYVKKKTKYEGISKK